MRIPDEILPMWLNFDLHYRVDAETGCFVWLRSCKGKEVTKGGGYGAFRDGSPGKLVGAHVHAWTRVHGPVPKGLQVRHSCHNTKCVNIAHLSTGTNKENSEDACRAGRRAKKLTPEIVREIRASYAAGVSQGSLGRKFGIAQGDVSHIVHRHWWAHVE